MCFVQGIWKHYYKEKYLSFTTVANNYFLTITCKLFSHYVKKNQHAEKQQKKTLKQKKISFIRQVKRISRWCLYFWTLWITLFTVDTELI